MITKEQLARVIERNENLAEGIALYEIEVECKQIQSESLNEDHLNEMLSNYMSRKIETYGNMDSWYQRANTQYRIHFEKYAQNGNKKTERIDFVATCLIEAIDFDFKDKKEAQNQVNLLKELESIEDIVYQTRLAEIQSRSIRNVLRQYAKEIELNASYKLSKTKMKSLQWLDIHQVGLNELHKGLIENGSIICKLPKFKKIFSGVIDYEKVKWLDTPSSLIYILQSLVDSGIIKVNYFKWKQLQFCFDYKSINHKEVANQIKNGTTSISNKNSIDIIIRSVSDKISTSPSPSRVK